MSVITDYWDRLDLVSKEKNISLVHLANATNIKYTAIKMWRAKKRIPNPEALISFSNCLDVSIDYLLKGDAETKIESEEVLAVKTNPAIRELVRRSIEDPRLLEALTLLLDEREEKRTPRTERELS